MMGEGQTQALQYARVAKAIEFMVARQQQQPSLQQVAAHVGLSESHLQRLFTTWAGVSPKQFLQFLTKEHAKQKLREYSVQNAAYASGLSGPARLHDLMVNHDAMTPGEYRQQGAGMEIKYGIHGTVFGWCLLAKTARGLCKVSFFDELAQLPQLESELKQEWPNAHFERNDGELKPWRDQIFKHDGDISLLLKGTPFQLQVWQALMEIPAGDLVSYQQLADAMGKSNSVRAVASAVAKNNVALVVPCHRVIRSTGVINQYRWGEVRKSALIAWEQSQVLG